MARFKSFHAIVNCLLHSNGIGGRRWRLWCCYKVKISLTNMNEATYCCSCTLQRLLISSSKSHFFWMNTKFSLFKCGKWIPTTWLLQTQAVRCRFLLGSGFSPSLYSDCTPCNRSHTANLYLKEIFIGAVPPRLNNLIN